MAAFEVDQKWRWNTVPRRRLYLFCDSTCSDLQIADLVEFHRLQTWISHWLSLSRYHVPDTEVGVWRERLRPRRREILGSVAFDIVSRSSQCITQIRVRSLIERAAQSDSRLDRDQRPAPPRVFSTPLFVDPLTLHASPTCIHDAAHRESCGLLLDGRLECGVRTV